MSRTIRLSEDEAKRLFGKNYTPPPTRKADSKIVEFSFTNPEDKMNATEKRYAEGSLNPMKYSKQILDWFFEAVTFTLAPKTTYTPDFFIIKYNAIDIVEIKGELQDDASVKFKIARETWPWFNWRMLRLKDGEFIQVRI